MKRKAVMLLLISLFTLPLLAQHYEGFGVKIGFFNPDGDYLDEWYGRVTSVGLNYLHPVGQSMNVEYAIEYMWKDGDEYAYYDSEWDVDIDGDSMLEIIPITLTLRYQPCSQSNLCPYLGAGIGYYMVEETLDYNVYDYEWDDYYSVTASDEDDVLGLHTVIGVDARIRSGGAFSAEIKWSWVEGDLWDEDMDFGGLSASLGYRFAF